MSGISIMQRRVADDPSGGRSVPELLRVLNPLSPAPRPSTDAYGACTPYFAPGREQQRQRHARILAVARRLLIEGGSRNITVRKVAELSNVSLQTIYNLVGNRTELIISAVSEQITLVTRTSKHGTDYPNMSLAVADAMWWHVAIWPDFTRQANAIYFGPDRGIYYRLREKQEQRLALHFRRQRERGLLRDQIDIDLLAAHFTLLVSGLSLEWSDGCFSLEALRVKMLTGYGQLLRDALVPSEAAKIDPWLGVACGRIAA